MYQLLDETPDRRPHQEPPRPPRTLMCSRNGVIHPWVWGIRRADVSSTGVPVGTRDVSSLPQPLNTGECV